MRKYPLLLLIVLLTLTIGVSACDSLSSGAANKNPQELLTAAWNTAKDATSMSGTYELTLTMDADAAQLPEGSEGMAQAFLGQPIKLSGEFAAAEDPMKANLSLTTSLMGLNMQVGGLIADGKAYVNMLGQWYEGPEDLDEQLAQSADTAGIAADLKKAMDEADFDPTSWCIDLKSAGEETLVDTDVVHLTSTVDVGKMLTDLSALMESEELAGALSSAGSTDTSDLGGLALPSTAELEEQLAGLEEMFKNATLDFWIAKSDSTMRKMTLTTDVVLPAEAAELGIAGGNVVATVNLDKAGQAVNIQAPASPKPFADLEQDIQTNPIFGLLLGVLSGGGSEGTSPFGL